MILFKKLLRKKCENRNHNSIPMQLFSFDIQSLSGFAITVLSFGGG